MITAMPVSVPMPPITILTKIARTEAISAGTKPNISAATLISTERVSNTTPAISVKGVTMMAMPMMPISRPLTRLFPIFSPDGKQQTDLIDKAERQQQCCVMNQLYEHVYVSSPCFNRRQFSTA